MDIINLILSIISIFAAIILFILFPTYSLNKTEKIINGSHEHFDIDDVIYNYTLNETEKIIKGSKYSNINEKIGGSTTKQSINRKLWYLNSWEEVYNNKNSYNQFLNDRHALQDWMYYDWENAIHKVMPYVYNTKTEVIGVLRVDNKDQLYVYDMSISPSIGNSESYAASVPTDLVTKYINIPGDFIFHSHPNSVNGDPFPSDGDIYLSLLNAVQHRFIGDVIFCIYGVIIYYISPEKRSFLLEDKTFLKYFTYCYDLINAWNAYSSNASKHSYSDHIKFLNQWGFNMIIIPSDFYIALNNNRFIMPVKLIDRFIKTKYKLADSIKKSIMFIEKKENEYKNKKKKITEKIR